MPANTWIIARREFATRLRSKTFWILTALLPAFLFAVSVVPTLLLSETRSAHRLVVVDATGRLGEALLAELAQPGAAPGSAPFATILEPATADAPAQLATLDRRVLDGEIDAWVWLDDAAVAAGRVEYHAASVANFLTQQLLAQALSTLLGRDRLETAGLDAERVAALTHPVELATVRVSSAGSREEGAATGFVLAYALFFLLYTVLIVYGQQVMAGVLEEKTNRIVEVVIATTRPTELMAGKLLGICAVALVQLGIWLALAAVATLPGLLARWVALPPGFDLPRLEPGLIAHFLAFFLLGFALYAALYAAIGAAFNNMQEAQQFAGLAAVLLVAPVFFFFSVLNDPDSRLSVVASLVPMFTPLLMLLRIAVKTPPAWQIALGYLLTTALVAFMVGLAARIYRVGILMVGKRPTLPELWRWVRYG
ncbi:MAG: ABC transporter permease [Thermoanaerobaculia bacterium]